MKKKMIVLYYLQNLQDPLDRTNAEIWRYPTRVLLQERFGK